MNLIIVMNRVLRKRKNLKVKILYMRKVIESYVNGELALYALRCIMYPNITIREAFLILVLCVVVRLGVVFGANLMPIAARVSYLVSATASSRNAPVLLHVVRLVTALVLRATGSERGFRLQSAE